MSQLETPSESVSSFPFAPVNGNLFTPVCLRTHWDPTEMLRHIIPQQHVGLPQDFRPWTKVCKNYVTSGPTIPAPMPPKNMVFPPGGEFYPPGRYSANIDVESRLKTLNYPLDKCDGNGGCNNEIYPFIGMGYMGTFGLLATTFYLLPKTKFNSRKYNFSTH